MNVGIYLFSRVDCTTVAVDEMTVGGWPTAGSSADAVGFGEAKACRRPKSRGRIMSCEDFKV